jgi:hypothetical protein
MELDLTREQFTEGEVIGALRVVARPPDLSVGRLAGSIRRLPQECTPAIWACGMAKLGTVPTPSSRLGFESRGRPTSARNRDRSASMISPLRPGRPLAALLVSEVVSSLGSLMSVVALPWFVLATSGSPARMGIVLAAESAPLLVFAVPSSAIVARLGVRRTLLACDLAWMVVTTAIPITHFAGCCRSPKAANARTGSLPSSQ